MIKRITIKNRDMKKLLFISFILLLSMSMAACGNSGDDSVTPDGNSGLSVDSVSGKRCLVLYCSRTGNTEGGGSEN